MDSYYAGTQDFDEWYSDRCMKSKLAPYMSTHVWAKYTLVIFYVKDQILNQIYIMNVKYKWKD